MHKLKDLVKFSTRSNKKLDSIYTDLSDVYIKAVKLSPISSSDHCTILCKPKNHIRSISKSTSHYIHDYSPSNRALFYNLLSNVQWSTQFDSGDINYTTELFLSIVESLYIFCFPTNLLNFLIMINLG